MPSAIVASLVDWSWVRTNSAMIWSDLGQHAELSIIAVVAGLVVSLPLSMVAWRFRVARGPILGAAGLLYTIPSIALFVLIQPVTGYFSLLSAEVALAGYTLLILVRNTVSGLDSISAEVTEAATAMGYTTRSQLLRIYLPIALPSVFAGLRVATVTVIGLVTVTSFIGRSNLGSMIQLGFNEYFYTPIVVALALSIALAAIGDAALVGLERVTVRWTRTRTRTAARG